MGLFVCTPFRYIVTLCESLLSSVHSPFAFYVYAVKLRRAAERVELSILPFRNALPSSSQCCSSSCTFLTDLFDFQFEYRRVVYLAKLSTRLGVLYVRLMLDLRGWFLFATAC